MFPKVDTSSAVIFWGLMYRLAALILAICMVVSASSPADAGTRVALVIGNSAYEHATPLKNPKNDADAVSAALEKLGFEVVKGTDLKHIDFAQVVGEFRKKLKDADAGVFFYAGHGLQVHGDNYLVPVDAELQSEEALEFEAVTLKAVLRLMERETSTNIVLLDACRDNPLARNLARGMGTRSTAVGKGMARVEAGIGTMISFATQPGNVALDGAGRNSPFTQALLNHIEKPGLDIANLMRSVRLEVLTSTGRKQVPWSNSSLTGSFMFQEKAKENPPAPPVAAVPIPRLPAVDPLAVELAFWQAAKDAGTRQAYEAYLNKYPEGSFAPLVAIHLGEIEQAEAAEKKRQAELETAKLKQAEAEKKRQSAEAEKRKQELAALEARQAAEREQLARERDELAQRLKAIEDAAKKKAEEKQNAEQKVAALQPADQTQDNTGATQTLELDAHTMTLVLQNELKRVGCDPGKVDGKWGGLGRKALSDFNQYASLKLPTGLPSMEAIEAIKGKTDRVCPLVCGPLHNEINGQCVAKTCPSGQQLNSRGQCINVVVQKTQKLAKPVQQPTAKKKSCRMVYNSSTGGGGQSDGFVRVCD